MQLGTIGQLGTIAAQLGTVLSAPGSPVEDVAPDVLTAVDVILSMSEAVHVSLHVSRAIGDLVDISTATRFLVEP